MDLLKIFTTTLLTWICLEIRNIVMATCPDLCQCESTVAKNKVNCIGLGLEEFTSEIPETTVLLNFSFNKIKSLQIYNGVKLLNLKTLDFAFNNIKYIHTNFLDYFPNLKFLDLSNNELINFSCHFPEFLEVFIVKNNKLQTLQDINFVQNLQDLDIQHDKGEEEFSNKKTRFLHLEVIDFTNNSIQRIHPCWLDSFPSLKYLNLSRNKLSEISKLECENDVLKLEVMDFSNNFISDIEPGSIKNLHQLKYLSLSHNKLTNIPEDIPI